MEPVTISFLTTGSDYADFKSAAMRDALRKGDSAALRVSGAAFVVFAFALMLFWGGSVFRNLLYILLALIGFAVCCSPDIIFPFVVRRRALQEYDSGKRRIPAQTVEFHGDFVSFLTERYSARIPYGMLHRAYENDRVFILYLGIDEIRFIPKRAMDESGRETVRKLLASQLKDKFKQEGAR